MGRVGLILNPAGPSATTMEGIPSLGIGIVVPAAPGTRSCVCPTTGLICWRASETWGGAPGNLMPAPTTSEAFSSGVMAEITLLTGSFPSRGRLWASPV